MPLNNFPKHQTVEWWIKLLKEMPPTSIVKIAGAGREDYMCLLSIYAETNRLETTVILDVGEQENHD